MNFKKYAILSMGLWVLGFGVYESQPMIAHADEQTTTSEQLKTTLSSTTNTYWYDGSVKLPEVFGDSISNKVVANFSDGQADVGERDVTITVDPRMNTSYNFSNDVDKDGLIELHGKVVVGDVKAKYVDTDGNEIAASTEANHSDDQNDTNYLNYTTKQLDINGYTFVKMDETSLPANGTLSGTGGTVIYVYKANTTEDSKSDSDDNNQSVTNAASSEVIESSESDQPDTDNESTSSDSTPSPQVDDSTTSDDDNSSSDDSLLNIKDSSSTPQTKQSGLLPATTSSDTSSSDSSTSEKSNDSDESKTAGQIAEDQGALPQTSNKQADFYTTLASFSLVSLVGLIGIRIIRH